MRKGFQGADLKIDTVEVRSSSLLVSTISLLLRRSDLESKKQLLVGA